MAELVKNNNLISLQITNELKKHFDKFIKIAEADCLKDKEEFNELNIEKQVDVINKLIEELGTIKRACEYIGISKSTIRDRFKAENYYYDSDEKKYKLSKNNFINIKEFVETLNFINKNSKELFEYNTLIEKNKKTEIENVELKIKNTNLEKMIQKLNLQLDSMREQIISSSAEAALWKQKYRDISIVSNDKNNKGRKSKLSCEQVEEIKKNRKEKKTVKELCEMFECSETTIRKALLR